MATPPGLRGAPRGGDDANVLAGAMLVAVLMVLGLVVAPATVARAASPDAVSVPGHFDAAMGCGGDWVPGCAAVQLAKRADDGVWSITLTLPAGSYHYKVAIDGSWTQNDGAGGAANGGDIPLIVPTSGDVTSYYDESTHRATTSVDAPIVTAAGSFQKKLGCPDDGSPDCLRSWLQDPDGDGTYTFTTVAGLAGQRFDLNGWQAAGSDPVGKAARYSAATGSFTVPARTVAVFDQR